MPASPIWTPGATLKEQPDSPRWQLGERIVQTRIYRGPYATAAAWALPRGTLGTGEQLGFRVARSSVERERGSVGLLRIEWEANGGESGQPLPPDEFFFEPFEINPPVATHPNFASLTARQKENCRIAATDSDEDRRADALTFVMAIPNPEGLLALDLFDLLEEGRDTYYLCGLRYIWTLSGWSFPPATTGGFIQTPGGPLAGYLPLGFSWLRQSDSVRVSGGIVQLTRQWLGAPSGHWDTRLYG
jgi:hypothetical protein